MRKIILSISVTLTILIAAAGSVTSLRPPTLAWFFVIPTAGVLPTATTFNTQYDAGTKYKDINDYSNPTFPVTSDAAAASTCPLTSVNKVCAIKVNFQPNTASMLDNGDFPAFSALITAFRYKN